jgi:hypothetical protein
MNLPSLLTPIYPDHEAQHWANRRRDQHAHALKGQTTFAKPLFCAHVFGLDLIEIFHIMRLRHSSHSSKGWFTEKL